MPSEVVEPPCDGERLSQAKGLSVRSGRHTGNIVWTQSQGHGANLKGRRAGGITRHRRGGYGRAFKPRDTWEGPPGICCDCQPDSGKPTVRDERGACGNVSYGGTRHPPRTSKERGLETLRLRLCAPHFYPTRANSQQGDAATYKDSWHQATN